ncbi:MAG: XdhC family protein, partial [Methyloprofundus sp.]|nr:XdhC family protein [Methyloprofundus sp.]
MQHKLQQQMRCALLTVLDCKGSTPAKTGAQMVLSFDAESIGTIGGGAIEYLVSQETSKLLVNHSQKIYHRQIITDEIGMLCG